MTKRIPRLLTGALSCSLSLAALSPVAPRAHAQAPAPIGQIISYQGLLTGAGGLAVPDGAQSLSFRIFENGAVVFTQNSPVVSSGGVFNAFLSVGALSFDPAKTYELGITFGGSETRHPIAAVPVALNAKAATTAATSVAFTGALVGDVSGTQGATTVEKIQGTPVADTAPTAGQVLRFNAASGRFEPSSTTSGTVTDVTASGPLASSGGATPNITLNGVVPVANGGTGSDTQNFVDLTTAQTVGGAKTFTAPVTSTQFNIGADRVLGTPGNNSVAVGAGAGAANTGNSNAFVGTNAGQANTTGNFNAFVGTQAGQANTTGFNNAFVGTQAGQANTTGGDNAFVGTQAGQANTTGDANAFLGRGAGQNNTTGGDNAFVGTNAGSSNTTGVGNIALGAGAGQNLTTGDNNIAIGNNGVAGEVDTTRIGTNGTQTRAFIAGIRGATALTGTLPVVVDANGQLGAGSGTAPVTAVTASGPLASSGGTTPNITLNGVVPVANGGTGSNTQNFVDLTTAQTVGGAKTFTSPVNTNTQYNIGGTRVLSTNGTNGSNTFVGQSAGPANPNPAAIQNTFVGFSAGEKNTADSNTFIGRSAGGNTTTGHSNTLIGVGAGEDNTTGIRNIAVGLQAGRRQTSSNNIAIGHVGTPADANTIRLGRTVQDEFGQGPHTSTFIAGIRGITPANANAVAVVIDSAGQLGTGTVPVSSGGTGSTTQNFVDLTTNQTVGGEKTFSQPVIASSTVSAAGNINTNTQYNIGGTRVLSTNGTNGSNTFVGQSAGPANPNPAAIQNTFVGFSAGVNSTANSNTFIGRSAGGSTTSGIANTFIGVGAGEDNTTGGLSIAVGHQAGRRQTGGNNIAIGDVGTVADSNTIRLGRTVLDEFAQGPHTRTFIAGISGVTVTGSPVIVTSSGQLGTGSVAASSLTLPLAQTASSASTLFALTNNGTGGAGSFSASGTAAALSATSTNANLNAISATGKISATSDINTSTQFNIAGSRVLALTGGADSVAVGVGAGAVNTGFNNAFLGRDAGASNTTGNDNVFLGTGAGISNTTGSLNIFVGRGAGANNTTGGVNIALGSVAGQNLTTGGANTFLGSSAGQDTTTGNFNVFVGQAAGSSNTTGVGNIALGTEAGQNLTTGNNNIVIGNNGVAGESNVTRLGNTSTQSIFIYGNQTNVVPSSRRFKQDIADIGLGSDWLLKLRPVSYRYTADYLKANAPSALQYGLIAEEVAALNPSMAHFDKDGAPDGVQYQNLPILLLSQIQKQKRELDQQQLTINELLARLGRLEAARHATLPVAPLSNALAAPFAPAAP